MSHSKGYAWESDVEKMLMSLDDQKRDTPLHQRTHRQPASGAKEYAKGDVVTVFDWLGPIGQLMVECKDRKDGRGDGKSVRFTKEEWDKARKEADDARHLPVFAFKFKSSQGGSRVALFRNDANNPMNTKGFAMPVSAFLQLLTYVRDLYREREELRRELAVYRESEPEVEVEQKLFGVTSAECRACRKALARAVRDVERVMGG